MTKSNYIPITAIGQRVKITKDMRSSQTGLIIPAGHVGKLLHLTKHKGYVDVGVPCYALVVPLTELEAIDNGTEQQNSQ